MARARACVAAGSAVATSSVSESKQGSLARITTHRLVERIDRGEITDATEKRPRVRTARRMLNTYKAKNGGRVSSSALSRAQAKVRHSPKSMARVLRLQYALPVNMRRAPLDGSRLGSTRRARPREDQADAATCARRGV